MKTLGSGAYLEEVGHWVLVLGGLYFAWITYSLALSLCFLAAMR
jgi:predicted tellurium resistance membrane protein TerC